MPSHSHFSKLTAAVVRQHAVKQRLRVATRVECAIRRRGVEFIESNIAEPSENCLSDFAFMFPGFD